MLSFDWNKIPEAKRLHKLELAARPIAERLDMLDRLRERAEELRLAGQTAARRDSSRMR